jgi:hypothetical protein
MEGVSLQNRMNNDGKSECFSIRHISSEVALAHHNRMDTRESR